jgi:hypothetical protein
MVQVVECLSRKHETPVPQKKRKRKIAVPILRSDKAHCKAQCYQRQRESFQSDTGDNSWRKCYNPQYF